MTKLNPLEKFLNLTSLGYYRRNKEASEGLEYYYLSKGKTKEELGILQDNLQEMKLKEYSDKFEEYLNSGGSKFFVILEDYKPLKIKKLKKSLAIEHLRGFKSPIFVPKDFYLKTPKEGKFFAIHLQKENPGYAILDLDTAQRLAYRGNPQRKKIQSDYIRRVVNTKLGEVFEAFSTQDKARVINSLYIKGLLSKNLIQNYNSLLPKNRVHYNYLVDREDVFGGQRIIQLIQNNTSFAIKKVYRFDYSSKGVYDVVLPGDFEIKGQKISFFKKVTTHNLDEDTFLYEVGPAYEEYNHNDPDTQENATKAKKLYRELAQEYHPDRGGDPEIFVRIGKAKNNFGELKKIQAEIEFIKATKNL